MTGPEAPGAPPAGTLAWNASAGLARALTPAEQRFEAWRRTIGYFAGPLAFAAVWLAPLPLAPDAHKLAAVMSFVVAWWIWPDAGRALRQLMAKQ